MASWDLAIMAPWPHNRPMAQTTNERTNSGNGAIARGKVPVMTTTTIDPAAALARLREHLDRDAARGISAAMVRESIGRDRATRRDRAAREGKARKVTRAAVRVADMAAGYPLLTAANIADVRRVAAVNAARWASNDPAAMVALVEDALAATAGRLTRERAATADILAAYATRPNAAVDRANERAAASLYLGADIRLRLLATGRGADSYASRFAARVTRDRSRRSGTGSGTMPTLSVDPFAVAAVVARVMPNAYTYTNERGEVVALSDDQRNAIAEDMARFERVELSPQFSPWINGLGQGMPNAVAGHRYAAHAPGIPTRDASPLSRGTLGERLAAVGVDPLTVAAVNAARQWCRDNPGLTRIPWETITADIGADVVAATIARRVKRAMSTYLTAAAFVGVDMVAANGTATPYHYPRTITRGTGRMVSHGSRGPVVAPSSMWRDPFAPYGAGLVARPVRGATVAAHIDIELAAIERGRGLGVAACAMHAAGECPRQCATREARRARIAATAAR